MEIERINENTVKFYISYVDIEERGFDREEIWYNRERSEELFWEMMDEVHREEEFSIEGPLWIQVQALEKGLEILVTKAQLSKDGQKFELPFSNSKMRDLPVDEQIEEMLDEHFTFKEEDVDEENSIFYDDNLEFLIYFEDFEDLISLASRINLQNLQSKLYTFENKYYLYIEFEEVRFSDEQIDNSLSVMLEYGIESQITIHRLQEYGKEVISEDVFQTIRQYFT